MTAPDERPLGAMCDRVLDALDGVPVGKLDGEVRIVRSLATTQVVAQQVGCSDSAARRAIHALHAHGLVDLWTALNPATGRRGLYVSAEAAR